MVDGFVLEYNKGEGFFCKRAREWKSSLKNRGKGRGLWAILTLLLPPDGAKQRRGPWGAGGHGPVALGAWRRPGIGGKGAGQRRDSIPLHDLGGGGL